MVSCFVFQILIDSLQLFDILVGLLIYPTWVHFQLELRLLTVSFEISVTRILF